MKKKTLSIFLLTVLAVTFFSACSSKKEDEAAGEAAILDSAFAKQIQDSGQYPDLDYLPVTKEVFFVRRSKNPI